MRRVLFSIVLLIFLLSPVVSVALELTYPEFQIGDKTYSVEAVADNPAERLNELIAWFYYFIVGISGFAAFAMLVWGGFQWLTSAGNPTKISDAKDRISSAFLGLIIILASFLILQVINPELTTLNLPGLGP